MASITETTSLILPAFNHALVLETTQAPPATTAPGSAVVRIVTASIRPHNRLGFTGNGPLSFPLPYAPGNSAIGRVVSVGPDAVALQPNQLVFVNGFVRARDDPEGTQMLLGLHDGAGHERMGKLFGAWKGLWTNVATVPMENCMALNETNLVKEMGYSFGDLNYIERLAVAYGGVSAAGLRAGETVIVAPATGHYSGAVAELAAQIGCRVIALSRSATKLDSLVSHHPRINAVAMTGDDEKDTSAIQALCPNGADALIDISPPEATSSPRHLAIALNTLRAGARVVFLGSMGDVSINYFSIMARNISIKGQFMYTREELVTLIKMIETGVVKLGVDAGHEVMNGGFAMEDWEEAVSVAERATQWGQHALFMP
ncbi:hypothetical protein QQX98_000984 [Neonectria punicea]|uniref:Alcohol dehydrogenase-like C-terminal domain-containing protein n=1 Tax=Neonectria punicea TaxID=979145 RepID=A0ABR1HSG6_9HYPO